MQPYNKPGKKGLGNCKTLQEKIDYLKISSPSTISQIKQEDVQSQSVKEDDHFELEKVGSEETIDAMVIAFSKQLTYKQRKIDQLNNQLSVNQLAFKSNHYQIEQLIKEVHQKNSEISRLKTQLKDNQELNEKNQSYVEENRCLTSQNIALNMEKSSLALTNEQLQDKITQLTYANYFNHDDEEMVEDKPEISPQYMQSFDNLTKYSF